MKFTEEFLSNSNFKNFNLVALIFLLEMDKSRNLRKKRFKINPPL
jgi:hypothetical protein